jgi:hypothetical protein
MPSSTGCTWRQGPAPRSPRPWGRRGDALQGGDHWRVWGRTRNGAHPERISGDRTTLRTGDTMLGQPTSNQVGGYEVTRVVLGRGERRGVLRAGPPGGGTSASSLAQLMLMLSGGGCRGGGCRGGGRRRGLGRGVRAAGEGERRASRAEGERGGGRAKVGEGGRRWRLLDEASHGNPAKRLIGTDKVRWFRH